MVLPPDTAPEDVAAALARESAAEHPKVYVPELWAMVGETRRAEVEARRYEMLVRSPVRE